MTVSPPRRALRGLLGADRSYLTELPERYGYSTARRAIAGLLGVRLTAPREHAGPFAPAASKSPGTERHTSAARAVAAADPVVRLTVRQSPLVVAVPVADLLVRAVDIVNNLLLHVGHIDRDSVGAPSHALVGELARDLARARPLVLDRAAFDFSDDLDLTLNSTSALARNLARASVSARDLIGCLAQDGNDPYGPVLAGALAGALADALVIALPLDPSLHRARYLARHFATTLTSDPGVFRASDLDSGLVPATRDLTRELASACSAAASDLLGIGRVDGLAGALLDGVLDDFSQADLSEADLAHISLVGVRWSVWGTRWPPGVEVEALIQQSEETELGSGIYVIKWRGETEMARETVHV